LKIHALFLAFAISALIGSADAQAQSPTGRHPVSPPQNAPTPTVAPVVPDTVQIRVSVPDTIPQPSAVYVVQDTLEFGGFLHLIVDYTSAPDATPVLLADAQWLAPLETVSEIKWREGGAESAVNLPALPAESGVRFVSTFRVYRRDPLQIAWQDQMSKVLFVRVQTDGIEQTATIRRPRSLSWTPWRLIIAGLIALVVASLIYGWWRRLQRPPPLTHWQPDDPAWVALAIGMQNLIHENALARGESRLFLDRLASLTRDYVAGRYRIAAREMTGEEIIVACQKLGHELSHPRGFAGLIKVSDRERYNPEAPAISLCREQAVKVFGRVEQVRLNGRYQAMPAERQLAGDQAWADLVRELGRPDRFANKTTSAQEVR
jgi:hypothetical protein